ncbi:hypothetical protein [Catenulispora subtropica]|uniref:Lipoprotein n=1 Tax=Catenulispora subtropica TaxID=450798 RepID=A0ABN2SW50_9ACTN
MRVLLTLAAVAAVLIPAVATAATTPAAVVTAVDKTTAPTVQPDPAAPGARIWIADAHCASPTGTATSPALTEPITLTMNKLSGPGVLRDDLISGTYTVTLHCGRTSTAAVHVVSATRNAGAVRPHGADDADDGAASDHLGIGDAALASAFVLGGITFGAVSLVRRRRGRDNVV